MKKIAVCLFSLFFVSAQYYHCQGPLEGHRDYRRPDLAEADSCRQCGCMRSCHVRYDEHAPLYDSDDDICASESHTGCGCECHQPEYCHYYWFYNTEYESTEDNRGLWPSKRIEFMDYFMR